MCFNAFDQAADLDVLDHPVLNFIYYLVNSDLPMIFRLWLFVLLVNWGILINMMSFLHSISVL